jgi:hypothetical protein
MRGSKMQRQHLLKQPHFKRNIIPNYTNIRLRLTSPGGLIKDEIKVYIAQKDKLNIDLHKIHLNVGIRCNVNCGLFTPFFLALQPSAGYGFLVHKLFVITHDAPQSVGFLWTSDQLVAETST